MQFIMQISIQLEVKSPRSRSGFWTTYIWILDTDLFIKVKGRIRIPTKLKDSLQQGPGPDPDPI